MINEPREPDVQESLLNSPLLGSTPSRGAMQENGCISTCCSAFVLEGYTVEDYMIEASAGNEEAEMIINMLIPLGTDEDGETMIYTCSNWEKESGRCLVYDKRPEMCRTYPDGTECQWPGCEYKGG